MRNLPWIRWCLFSNCLSAKFEKHWSHLYGFCPNFYRYFCYDSLAENLYEFAGTLLTRMFSIFFREFFRNFFRLISMIVLHVRPSFFKCILNFVYLFFECRYFILSTIDHKYSKVITRYLHDTILSLKL